MAQAATNPKIEELRFRLKSDVKSRLFYPLAEELRKINQYDEAEKVLRTGLANHPTYLSAWVSLGRVLKELGKHADAVEALNKALQLDPGNVVAARILADAYLALGEKVEAIKKYKLVLALLPGDQELEATIARLDSEINAPAMIPEPDTPFELTGARKDTPAPPPPAPPPPPSPIALPTSEDPGRVFDETGSAVLKRQQFEIATGDSEPMSVAHSQSPFEEAGIEEGYGADAFSIEQPGGMHVSSAPMTAELPMPLPFADAPAMEEAPRMHEPAPPADDADLFEPAPPPGALAPGFVTPDYAVTSSMPPLDEEDFARTIRMADLYAMEGSYDEARDIYEDLLARDPNNAMIREKLASLATASPAPAEESAFPVEEEEPEQFSAPPVPPPQLAPEPPPAAAAAQAPSSRNPKVEKLEGWLAKVKRGEVSDV